MKNETIYDTDFGVYTKPIFAWLAEYGYILLDNHEIKFNNLVRIRLLKQLNDNVETSAYVKKGDENIE